MSKRNGYIIKYFASFRYFLITEIMSPTPTSLRDQLRAAIKFKDIDSLEAAIEEAEAIGYPELGSDIRKARETLASLGGSLKG